MKIAYLDCFSGASGDMINGALLDAGVPIETLRQELQKLPFEHFEIRTEKVMRCGISATRFEVLDQEEADHHPEKNEEGNPAHHHHSHRHLKDLEEMIDHSALQEELKEKARQVFRLIAVAEAKIHQMPVEEVHFHEVGAVDTIIDVVGALVGFQILGIGKVLCSPINVGTGTVVFSHGTFPVPAPATVEILRGVPIYSTDSQAELVTPTGAAIVTALASGYGEMPAMRVERIGYGAGFRDLRRPNVLRLLLGQTEAEEDQDRICVLETCLDDQNPQLTAYLAEELFGQGALDVYLTPIIMKKGRPGVQCTVLCEAEKQESLLSLLFRESTTIGVRTRWERRRILRREVKTVPTPYGPVQAKFSFLGDEMVNVLPEFEDMKKMAGETGIPLKNLYKEILPLLLG